jgi:AraC-like DNA-binding protein
MSVIGGDGMQDRYTKNDSHDFQDWRKQVKSIIDDIDRCIINRDDDALTLSAIAESRGYSEFHMSRKFKELAGLGLGDYLRKRRLTFALADLRETDKSILDIAIDHGFSSHEAFGRSFKAAYGIPPSTYRAKPRPLVLRTKITALDRLSLGLGEIAMIKSSEDIKVYFVSIPAHKFLHIKNYESDGYFDFWEEQNEIPGMDCDTICNLLDRIDGKLDGEDGVIGRYSGQVMARIFEGGHQAEAYGVRLPAEHAGDIPAQMIMLDVPEAEYIVFEHGSFDFEQECENVGENLQTAIDSFDYNETNYLPDNSVGRISYYCFNPARFEKRIFPVKRQ